MAHQQELRKGTRLEHDAFTGVNGEVTVETTNKRPVVHDGARLGGWPVPNFADVVGQKFQAATATGTDDLVVNLPDNPGTPAFGARMTIKAAATNTGAMRVNRNGAGLQAIKKYSSGAKVAIDAGDIAANMVVDLTFDGTDWICTPPKVAPTLIAQANLKTSVGTVSTNLSTSWSRLTMPGGQYGFYPRTYVSGSTGLSAVNDGGARLHDYATGEGIINSPASYISLRNIRGGSVSMVAEQTYILSSPPFDLGDGEVAGFLYLLMNADNTLASTYFGRVPPWAYNGPSQLRADYIDPETGLKYRRRRLSLQQLKEGQKGLSRQDPAELFACAERAALDEHMKGCRPSRREKAIQEFIEAEAPRLRQECLDRHFELICNDIKNADMALIPHPFLTMQEGQTVVLVDPMNDTLSYLFDGQDDGDAEIIDAIGRGLITVDSASLCKAKAPPGVACHNLLIK